MPALTVVVVAYGMSRELPRTLQSLAPTFQEGIDPGDYEVVVVDNGSPTPVDPALWPRSPGRVRTLRLDRARRRPRVRPTPGSRRPTASWSD